MLRLRGSTLCLEHSPETQCVAPLTSIFFLKLEVCNDTALGNHQRLLRVVCSESAVESNTGHGLVLFKGLCADGIDARLKGQPVEAGKGKLNKGGYATAQGTICLGKNQRLFGIRSDGLDRVRQAPMAGNRLALPRRAFLGCSRIADSKDEIHHRGARPLELGNVLRAQNRGVVPIALQNFQCEGVGAGSGLGAGRKRYELAAAQIAK